VTVTVEGLSGRAVVKVRDTGVGMSAVDQLHAFEPFSQAPQSLDRSRGGLGLGLAMVKGLVELQGGSVQVHSQGAGLGTEAQVVLPLRAPPQPPAMPSRGALARGQRKVLVVDDNEDVAESLRDVLAMLGHSVEVASDGEAAIARARVFHPEVVVCDLGLPVMDGYAFARAMRADSALSKTWLVALSGYARPEDRLKSAEAGFDCHLAKPPTIDELETAVLASASASSASPSALVPSVH
jgi:two-component system CheB/CheR fusion protein